MSRLDEIRRQLRERIREEPSQDRKAIWQSAPPRPAAASRPTAFVGRPMSQYRDIASADSHLGGSGMQPNKRALFIGNNAYQHQSELNKCVNDALEMQKMFADIRYRLVFDFDLDLESMQRTFNRFKEDIQPNDELVIGFSGHGLQINSELYLCPIDVPALRDPKEYFSVCINLHKEMDEMFERGAKMVIAIIDACRNQIRVDYEELYGQGVRDGLEIAEFMDEKSVAKKAAPRSTSHHNEAQGRAVVFATSHNTSALEYSHMSHGIFTHFFLQEAKIPGRTIQEVIERVRRAVIEFTESRQAPAFYNDLKGDYYFQP